MSLVRFKAKNHPQQVAANGAHLDTDDRETPPLIFDPLHQKHRFTLDAAATPDNAKGVNYYTVAKNGLSESWAGHRVWCNPPYSNIGAWVEKAWRAMLEENAILVVMLLPSNRTEQKWWQADVEPWRDGRFPKEWEGWPHPRRKVELSVEFLPGRPRFFRPSGKLGGPKGDRPPFGCCVLTWKRAS